MMLHCLVDEVYILRGCNVWKTFSGVRGSSTYCYLAYLLFTYSLCCLHFCDGGSSQNILLLLMLQSVLFKCLNIHMELIRRQGVLRTSLLHSANTLPGSRPCSQHFCQFWMEPGQVSVHIVQITAELLCHDRFSNSSPLFAHIPSILHHQFTDRPQPFLAALLLFRIPEPLTTFFRLLAGQQYHTVQAVSPPVVVAYHWQCLTKCFGFLWGQRHFWKQCLCGQFIFLFFPNDEGKNLFFGNTCVC